MTGALLNGSNFGQIAKNTLVGGLVGAAGAFLNFASADPNILVSIAKHSFSQGWLDGIQGGNIVHGFMMGAVSKIGGTAVDSFSPYTGMVGGLLMNSILTGVIDELGGGKFANGVVTGSFSYLFNETLHRVQDRGDSDDSESMLATAIEIAVPLSAVDGPLPVGDIIGASIVSAAAVYDIVQFYKKRVYLTYTLINDYEIIYIGRTSGFGDPHKIMMQRFNSHHMKKLGFKNPQLDKYAQGDQAYGAIRGREQQMIDAYGGANSRSVANRIRGVAECNPAGRWFHHLSNIFFGNIAPYTGW